MVLHCCKALGLLVCSALLVGLTFPGALPAADPGSDLKTARETVGQLKKEYEARAAEAKALEKKAAVAKAAATKAAAGLEAAKKTAGKADVNAAAVKKADDELKTAVKADGDAQDKKANADDKWVKKRIARMGAQEELDKAKDAAIDPAKTKLATATTEETQARAERDKMALEAIRSAILLTEKTRVAAKASAAKTAVDQAKPDLAVAKTEAAERTTAATQAAKEAEDAKVKADAAKTAWLTAVAVVADKQAQADKVKALEAQVKALEAKLKANVAKKPTPIVKPPKAGKQAPPDAMKALDTRLKAIEAKLKALDTTKDSGAENYLDTEGSYDPLGFFGEHQLGLRHRTGLWGGFGQRPLWIPANLAKLKKWDPRPYLPLHVYRQHGAHFSGAFPGRCNWAFSSASWTSRSTGSMRTGCPFRGRSAVS